MATETIRPNAAGDEESISGESPAVPHWQNVDEATQDGTSTMIWSGNSLYQRDLYNLQNHSVGSGTINYVRVVAICVSPVTPDQNSIRLSLKSGGVLDDGATQEAPTGWTWREEIWTEKPGGGAWGSDWSIIDNLQAGICLREPQDGDSETYCTQLYVQVDYTPDAPTEKESSDTGAGADAKEGYPAAEHSRAETGSGADAKASGNPSATLTGSDQGYCGQVLEG